jgi:hypothetical protein
MRTRRLSLLCASVAAWAAAEPTSLGRQSRDADLPVVTGQGYRGVIFPRPPFRVEAFDGDAAWTPASADVAILESLLKTTLEEAVKDPDLIAGPRRAPSDLPDDVWRSLREARTQEIGKILGRLGTYRRQYAGISRKGIRTIIVNLFPEEQPSGEDWHRAWRSEWVDVHGGGVGYWHIRFDVRKKAFHDYYANSPR